MARGDYGPEVKAAMQGAPNRTAQVNAASSAADQARDRARGIKEGSAEDNALDALPQNRPGAGAAPTGGPRPGAGAPASIQVHRMPNDAHHIAAATSIAHAILGNSRVSGGAGGGPGSGRGVL